MISRWRRLFPPPLAGDVRCGWKAAYSDLVIRFDGVDRAGVVAYNVVQGWIDLYVTDKSGKVTLVGDDLAYRRLYGSVSVRWRAGA